MSTTICYRKDNTVILANNEDAIVQTGMLFSNHREIKKIAYIIPPEKPFEWTSRFGSISFSQSGKEFPSSGMNEVGFVAQQIFLSESAYSKIDDQQVIKEFQVVQMLLDLCETSKEAQCIIESIRISKFIGMMHFIFCDRSGDFRIVEIINGELKFFGENGERVPVLSNSKYEESLKYLKGIIKPGDIEDPIQKNSFDCFVKACMLTSRIKEYLSSPVITAFDLLTQVNHGSIGWTFVYDCSDQIIHVRDNGNKSRISIPLRDIDFSKEGRKLAMDIACKKDILCEQIFTDYDFSENKDLVESFFYDKSTIKKLGIKLPMEILFYLALYPEKQEN